MQPLKKKRGDGGPVSRIENLPAPVLGWNTRDSVANMKSAYALDMLNFYPSPTDVVTRGGSAEHKTGFAATEEVYSLFTYASASTEKMFGATDLGIYDVSSAGAVTLGGFGIALTSGKCHAINFRTSAGPFLLVVNGADTLKLYNGTTWASITGVSTPAITGLTTSNIAGIASFKSRVWFIEKDSLSAWYLPVDSIAGAATQFPLGPFFSAGGSLVAIESWSVDAGVGVDDYLAFISSKGQVAVYKGTDPASPTTFALSGVYSLGEPVGSNCCKKIGGDVIILTKSGIYSLGKVLAQASGQMDKSVFLSDIINPSYSLAASLYKDLYGWSIAYFEAMNALVINVPVSATESVQLVRNALNGAWTRFSGWDAFTFCTFQGNLYYGTTGYVIKAWTGLADRGANITYRAQQAYSYLRSASTKQVKMVRPTLLAGATATLSIAVEVDFGNSADYSNVLSSGAIGAAWDTGTWDTATWGEDTIVVRPWCDCACNEGFAVSLKLQIVSNKLTANWSATDILYESGAGL